MCHFICVMTFVLILAVINPINTLVTTDAQSRNIYEDVPAVWFDIMQFSIMVWKCKSILYIITEAKKKISCHYRFYWFIRSHTPQSLKCSFPGLISYSITLIHLPLPHKHINMISITSYLPIIVKTKSDKQCCQWQLVSTL